MAGGYEALLLRSQVAQALIADKRLKGNYDLRPDRLLPEYYERVKATFENYSARLTFDDTIMEVYRSGKAMIAVENRLDENRYSLFLGHTMEDLRGRAARDFVRRGMISDPDTLKIVS